LAEVGYDLYRGYFVTRKPVKMNASNRSLADLRVVLPSNALGFHFPRKTQSRNGTNAIAAAIVGHMMPYTTDQTARVPVLTDLDATLLVEAGAGTGKTALMAGCRGRARNNSLQVNDREGVGGAPGETRTPDHLLRRRLTTSIKTCRSERKAGESQQLVTNGDKLLTPFSLSLNRRFAAICHN
jgi:hypothetical protein